jgi:hypothetical protein
MSQLLRMSSALASSSPVPMNVQLYHYSMLHPKFSTMPLSTPTGVCGFGIALATRPLPVDIPNFVTAKVISFVSIVNFLYS